MVSDYNNCFPSDLGRSDGMQIGPYKLRNRLALAPMAGISDRPFRLLCKRLGAGYTVTEMIASDRSLWGTDKSRRRRMHDGETGPFAVQIAGTDPTQMAEAARFNVDQGADIIDINLGCPAKKVCNVLAGSALMRDELLVGRIIEAVVSAVDVPVTLKMRTGWDRQSRNAERIARVAVSAGVSALAVHGRTRADFYNGLAEYDTIAAVKATVSVPVMANGDIDSPAKASHVLELTGADGLMIGRAAQGRPWIFREINAHISGHAPCPEPSPVEIRDIVLEHVAALFGLYGEPLGARVARKHVGWYSRSLRDGNLLRQQINVMESASEQTMAITNFFDRLVTNPERSWETGKRAA